jgi:thiol-disulfide isomerase/thioredoxin
MTRILLFGFFALTCITCSSPQTEKTQLSTGIWRATLHYQEKELPFNFHVVRDAEGGFDMYIINARERLHLDDVFLRGDSVIIPLHIFDASFEAKLSGDSLQGIFIKHYDRENTIPFTAVAGQSFRFKKGRSSHTSPDFSGKYRVQFFNAADTTDAIGIFLQKKDSLTGTFLTATGDYRFLQGNVVNDTLHLSAFDGNHAYLFVAASSGKDEMEGYFYSGRTKKTLWRATRDDNAALPDPESLTFLKPGYEKIDFTFPDPDGNPVSLNDDRFKDKVVILQLSGTWCPNCMDETKFLAPWYDKNKDRGVEIIGLAYERKDDFEYARDRVRKMMEKLSVNYQYVIAGTNDKTKASQSLPMLNRIVSFPTTIFIDKQKNVKKIHTGFTGPGTGEYYEQFIEDFNETVNELLKEAPAKNEKSF